MSTISSLHFESDQVASYYITTFELLQEHKLKSKLAMVQYNGRQKKEGYFKKRKKKKNRREKSCLPEMELLDAQ